MKTLSRWLVIVGALFVASIIGAALPIIWSMWDRFSFIYFLLFFVCGLINHILLGAVVVVPMSAVLWRKDALHWWLVLPVWYLLGGFNWWLVSATATFLEGGTFTDALDIIVKYWSLKVLLWPAGPLGALAGVVFWLIVRSQVKNARALY